MCEDLLLFVKFKSKTCIYLSTFPFKIMSLVCESILLYSGSVLSALLTACHLNALLTKVE
jgi:hypothetical protein